MERLRDNLLSVAPKLASQLDTLVSQWLSSLINRLEAKRAPEFRPKQVNDPVWGTIELLPWEVGLLDTPLLQRMRGVRQLGLAQLVFPGASHGRLEHIIGVVGAIEEVLRALERQIQRWNRDHSGTPLPSITDADRYALRLAGLLHDVGHGPFSHALEPVLEVNAPLVGTSAGESEDWRREIKIVRSEFKRLYQLNAPPSESEVIAACMVLSEPMKKVLASDRLFTARGRPVEELQEVIVAAIIGGVEGPGASHLSSIVSSQIDADKLDYLSRDAHHSGLEIGFDTDRLLSRLEILHVRESNVDASESELRARASRSVNQTFHQLGIAASGFGSFEQMLIGRTFLYDRLYHHHKVRSAEAMAQRLMLVAERDRASRFRLDEIFLSVDDDTMLRILAQEVTHPGFPLSPEPSAATALAKGILNRELLHRAFAFRGRFIASPPGLDGRTAEQNREKLWRRIVKELDDIGVRFNIGAEIHRVAIACAEALMAKSVDVDICRPCKEALDQVGPEQIIVDLPALKAEAIRILARYPNGAIKVPEFSFNPVKWSDAYELQKRTGYVFCPRDVVPLVALASKIVFLGHFGVTMSEEADGYIKTASIVPQTWINALVAAKIIDTDAAEHLSFKRHSLLALRADDLKVPGTWIQADPDIASRLALELNQLLRAGLTAEHIEALGRVLGAVYAFVDHWYKSGQLTRRLENEAELQKQVLSAFQLRSLPTEEGSVAGGGKLDIFVDGAVLVENKFTGRVADVASTAPAAGMQGRRYAIALGAQVVIVVLAYELPSGIVPAQQDTISVHEITRTDGNRAEIRVSLPYGAVTPSRESPQ
ncbi:metal-dependent phosphohydrolase HD domain-containing protein (plasmid) [Rhizobium sp. CIAT894]|uniref:HD domain-containing protein n=1 Tax=Rhizobium sp. CIAT894 TaxID=2020312 RepID=UPI0001909E1D|nr:HD domain-containing protein [Rhizobium sp. CIAT894]ARM91053.1 metal-dependent phosphohydrolase HD domain-containing protein [Rhizobium sp. CIAT894]